MVCSEGRSLSEYPFCSISARRTSSALMQGARASLRAFGIGAAPCFNEVAYIAQEMRQALLERFAPPQVSAIETDHAALQFTHPFANGCAVPSQFALGETLPAGTEHFDRARHEDAARTAFQ
jgi:hypothetical protein